jgi:hypothetical protein
MFVAGMIRNPEAHFVHQMLDADIQRAKLQARPGMDYCVFCLLGDVIPSPSRGHRISA